MKRENAVAESGELLVVGEAMISVGDPTGFEAHQPICEFRCGPRPLCLTQQRWCGGGPSGDVFPSGDGWGVASPAVKMSSTSNHSLSDSVFCLGEPAGPCRARSMT